MVRIGPARLLALSFGLLILLTSLPARSQVPATDPGESSASPDLLGQPALNGSAEPSPPAPLPMEADQAIPGLLPPIAAGPADHAEPGDSSGRGVGGFSPIFDPVFGHAAIRTDYRVTWLPAEP